MWRLDFSSSSHSHLRNHKLRHASSTLFLCPEEDCQYCQTTQKCVNSQGLATRSLEKGKRWQKKSEDALAKDLKDAGILFKVRNSYVTLRSINGTGAYIDFVLQTETHDIYLENDERQHKGYDQLDEIVRMHNVVEVQRAAGDERKKLWVRQSRQRKNRHDQEEVYAKTTY